MAQSNEATFQQYAVRDSWRLAKNLLGGAIILAVWLALWTWLALGVVRPLSGVTARPSAASVAESA